MSIETNISEDKEHIEYLQKAQKASEAGRLKALKLHKAFGVPIVTEKDRKIVEIPADEKLAESETTSSVG